MNTNVQIRLVMTQVNKKKKKTATGATKQQSNGNWMTFS